MKRDSVEEELILDRLSKPVDHSQTRKRLEREQKMALNLSRQSSRSKSHSRHRKSNKSKKQLKSQKQLLKEYRKFLVNKFGKENDPI